MRSIWTFLFAFILCVYTLSCVHNVPPPLQAPTALDGSFEINNVTIDPNIFHPAKGERINISCRLSQPGKAILSVFSMDQRLIQELLPASSSEALSPVLNFSWDGRDLDGHMVPNGAFGITIRANNYKGDQAVFDSFEGHSNRYLSIEAKYDRKTRQVRYSLPGPAQVSIRAGVGQGPLLNNISGWRPRPAGANAEPWDGKDASGTVDVLSIERGYLLAEAITLPERIILAEGNDQYSHATYSKTYTIDRPLKDVATETVIKGDQNEILYNEIPTGSDRIDVHLMLSGSKAVTADNEPVINGKTTVKVYLSERSKQVFAGERYEIICFADYNFITEFEEGFSPTTWILDAGKLTDGSHVLTINVATLSGQMGSASMKVFVNNH